MKFFNATVLLGAVVAAASGAEQASSSTNLRARSLQPDQEETIDGTLYLDVIDYEDHTDEQVISIQADDGTSYVTDLTPAWAKANNVELGSTRASVKGRGRQNAGLANAKATIVRGGNNRDLAERKLTDRSTGTRTVLAVIIQDFSRNSGEQVPTFSETTLSTEVFGSGGGQVSLRSQYDACSQGQLMFDPVAGKTSGNTNLASNISNGVVTVTVNTGCTTNACDSTLHNAATSAINTAFGQQPYNIADHVMYCLPPNAMSGIAYANLPGWRSVYKDKWCVYLSGQMHEIGHNIRFHHANEANTYQDQSGMMGYSYSQWNGPVMCFNAAKSWESGWYDKNKETFTVGTDTSKTVVLKGIATVDASNVNEKALIKIQNSASSIDHYINFNHQTGMNSGTVEGANRVMVVSAGSEGTGGAQSTLLSKMTSGGSWTQAINGEDVTVTVNNIDTAAGTATITVSSVECSIDADCDDNNVCNGAETCSNGSCIAGQPLTCSNGLFCDGEETCDAINGCQPGTPPCPDDGNPCNGVEVCSEDTDQCTLSSPAVVCGAGATCGGAMTCQPVDASAYNCVDNGAEDGTCSPGEDCNSCPNDCPSGETAGAVCGNGICEIGNGENCVDCPADCNGRTGGKPSNRYCCGADTFCGDSRCGTDCSSTPKPVVEYCCGDNVCDGDETYDSCSIDCPAPVPTPFPTAAPTQVGGPTGPTGPATCGDLTSAGSKTCKSYQGCSWSKGRCVGELILAGAEFCSGSGGYCSGDDDCCGSSTCKGNSRCS